MEGKGTKFLRWKEGLLKSRQFLLKHIERLVTGKKGITPDLLSELEEILIRSDLGVHLVDGIISELKYKNFKENENVLSGVKKVIENKIIGILGGEEYSVRWQYPLIILVVGVNGSGKTSTIGKLAFRFYKEKKKVLVAAADTFRAAAIEQLEIWKERAGVDLVKGNPGSDPAAVVYDAGKMFIKGGYQVLLIDTAGRLHTKTNLMEELKKIKRTVEKVNPGICLSTLLVLDATCGQNGIQQAKLFQEAINIDGLILTKLDGTSKGGIVVSIKENLGIPVKLIGLGEGIDDLQDFSPKDFVGGLMEG